MKKNNLSALLITEPTNLFYFTGASYFGEMSFPRPAVLIIPRNGDSILVTHDFHLAIDWDGDIRRYPKVGEVPIEMVKSAFEDAGCTTGQVGADFGREQRLGMSYQDFTKVQDALPAVRLPTFALKKTIFCGWIWALSYLVTIPTTAGGWWPVVLPQPNSKNGVKFMKSFRRVWKPPGQVSRFPICSRPRWTPPKS